MRYAGSFGRDLPRRSPPSRPRPGAPGATGRSTPVGDALGLVLAESVTATEAVPPFANTAMDGFAVRSADTAGAPVTLDIVETIAAGHAPTVEVGPGQASRIFTGAPMPDGADAVVMVERTAPLDGDRVHVEIEVPVGNHVRPVGDDLDIGRTVLRRRRRSSPPAISACSTASASRPCRRIPRMRVGVVSTGDELVEGGGALAPGQIRDSNRRTLLALAAQAGCDVVDLGIARDTEAAITAAIERGVAECDAVLTSGGVSMGDIDLVKVILDRIGDMRWMQIAIRPAKPFAFGRGGRHAGVRLPRQPRLVDGELRAASAGPRCVRPWATPTSTDRSSSPWPTRRSSRRPDGKIHFARVVARHGADGRVHVRSAGGQGSHQLGAMAACQRAGGAARRRRRGCRRRGRAMLLDELGSEQSLLD